MSKREKKPVMAQISPEQAETIMGEYAGLDAKIVEINAKMDQQITQIRDKYSDQLQNLGEKREEKLMQLQWFAENNQQFFEKKKSMDMAHGTIGFRTGTPKLKTLKGFTWSSVTNLLKEFLPSYVRTVDEPAKDKLLADRDEEIIAKQFTKVGIEVVQDESFYVELKKEEFVNQ